MAQTKTVGIRYSYKKQDRIGSGGQADVYIGTDIVTGEQVAIKNLYIKGRKRKLAYEREKENIENLESPYIVKYLYSECGIEEENKAYFVMEYIDGGTLQEYMDNNLLDEATARRWMWEMVLGMNSVWNKNIIHRDLKPENILLTERSKNAHIKLCDFGFSKNIRDEEGKTHVGTYPYMAPEVQRDNAAYGVKADIYSLGFIYYEMLLENSRGMNLQNMILKVHDSSLKEITKLTILEMLVHDPEHRITQEKLLNQLRLSRAKSEKVSQVCETLKAFDEFESCFVTWKQFRANKWPHFKATFDMLRITIEQGRVTLIDQFEAVGCYHVFTSYCEGGDLRSFITANGPVNELIAKKWMSDLLQAVTHMHDKQFIHMNLSPESIKLTKPDLSAELKLSDFEMSLIEGSNPYEGITASGTVTYWAPEQIAQSNASRSIDVWSLGCVFYYLLQGEDPVQSEKLTFDEKCTEVLKKQRTIPALKYCSEKCQDLVQRMMQVNPTDRISIEDCLGHSLFRVDYFRELSNCPAVFPEDKDFYELVMKGLPLLMAFLDEKNVVGAYLMTRTLHDLTTKVLSYYRPIPNFETAPMENFGTILSEFLSAQKSFAKLRLKSLPIKIVDCIDAASYLYRMESAGSSLKQAYYEMFSQLFAAKQLSLQYDAWIFGHPALDKPS